MGATPENTQKMPLIPSLERLIPYSDQIDSLLAEYGDILVPRLVEYEVELSEFPVEVLNEIRAIYAHLYRASVSNDDKGIVGNLEKAKSHSKRAILDCYKYLCVTYDDRYHAFFKKYNYVNWHKSKLSADISKLNDLRSSAVRILRDAKELESTENKSKQTDYHEKYKLAYETYYELNKTIRELETRINSSSEIVNRTSGFIAALCGVLGIGFGILLCVFL